MIAGLVNIVIYLLILGIVVALIYYVVDAIPLPDPINRIIKVAVVVLCALVIVILLLGLLGVDGGTPLPRLVPQ